MYRALSLIVFGGGLLAMAYGLFAYNAESNLARVFAGEVSEAGFWLLPGGGAGVVAGIVGLWRGFKGYTRAFSKLPNNAR